MRAMVTRCGVCGKITAVTWPEFYVYKSGGSYYCSANCMVVADVKRWREKSGFVKEDSEMRGKITLEQKKKAVEIALEGGDPREYLKKCGSKNPDAHWYYIKNKLKETDPDTYYKLLGPVGVLAEKLDAKNEPEDESILKVQEEEPDLVPGDKVTVVVEGEATEQQVVEHKITVDENGIKVDDNYVLGPASEEPEESQQPAVPNEALNRVVPYGFRVREVEGEHGFYRREYVLGGDENFQMTARIGDASAIMLRRDEWLKVAQEIIQALATLEI